MWVSVGRILFQVVNAALYEMLQRVRCSNTASTQLGNCGSGGGPFPASPPTRKCLNPLSMHEQSQNTDLPWPLRQKPANPPRGSCFPKQAAMTF